MDDMERIMERIKIAYKKFKANVYFDKTQLPLRDRIVKFEEKDIDAKLKALHDALMGSGDWEAYEQEILKEIRVWVYPKKLKSIAQETMIFNADNIPIEMEDAQYFIDLPVVGHILGTLWVLTIGLVLDKEQDTMYEHSYGNRLRRTLVNPNSGEITYSPGLFEPYFAQYERWRDHGLEKAKKSLDDKQDAIILTLDFKSFYYSVHLEKCHFESILKCMDDVQPWHEKLNQFVFHVIECYSNKLRQAIGESAEPRIEDRNVMPIGFLPSNILSNWVLMTFDNAINDDWNPVYYGRYVDDIIIVDKVEKNDPLYQKAREETTEERLTADYIIQRKLVDRGIFRDLTKDGESIKNIGHTYQIAEKALRCTKSAIRVQSKKVRLFYFQSGATRALLDCFKTKIAQNVSEFRSMPNLDNVLQNHNYSEIFNLRNEEGINKFRGITGIDLDKFVLSKFLGKYRKVSGMIQSREENVFEKDIMLILDERTLIANYSAWERLFEILVINNRFELYRKLSLRILDALTKYSVPVGKCTADIQTHDALLRTFLSALQRTAAIIWNTEIEKCIKDISEKVALMYCTYKDNHTFLPNTLLLFEPETIEHMRKAYCKTRMVNKYLLPLPIDCVLAKLEKAEGKNFSNLNDMWSLWDVEWLKADTYVYYPYMLTPHELSFVMICNDLLDNVSDILPNEHQKTISQYFLTHNYPYENQNMRDAFALTGIKCAQLSHTKGSGRECGYTAVSCDTKPKNKIKAAVGSTRLSLQDFEKALDNRPNRSYARYKRFANVFDEAIHQKADMLVLPENFLPFEWIPIVARFCANNHLALVTGVEHIVVPDKAKQSRGQVYNLTVTILPYQCEEYPFASISYHNKTAYSPGEQEQITGRRYSFKEGNTYQLFGWHNVWFPVYCCFELASIRDRSLFQTFADMIVAVEWNKDIPYYSSIAESLSRDLHCYCIQSNSSDYGDSRIIAPKSTVEKDIIKTKGGLNDCVLVEELNIKALRDFQVLDFPLQKQNGAFKPSPPGSYDDTILEAKRQNRLAGYLEDIEKALCD